MFLRATGIGRLEKSWFRKAWGIEPKALARSSKQMVKLHFWDLASSMAHSSSIVCSWIQCTPSRKPFCSGESHPFPISTTVVREAGEEFVDRREERSAGSCCNHRSNPSCKWRWNGETFQQLGTPSRHTAAYKTSSRRHIKSRQEMSLYSTPSTPGAVFDALLSFAMIIVLVGRLARYSCGPVAVVVFGSNL